MVAPNRRYYWSSNIIKNLDLRTYDSHYTSSSLSIVVNCSVVWQVNQT